MERLTNEETLNIIKTMKHEWVCPLCKKGKEVFEKVEEK